ncbi:hypothetical protein HU200_056554 [Digitaria exilis]|uniref:Uncharacterized protein n=1 Tax=Digitaria exilis TaxID=1010633 RepID=A0A835E0R9_9POAL|nr:hypothetical protein HU200_056554 [Digitaria exilis]
MRGLLVGYFLLQRLDRGEGDGGEGRGGHRWRTSYLGSSDEGGGGRRRSSNGPNHMCGRLGRRPGRHHSTRRPPRRDAPPLRATPPVAAAAAAAAPRSFSTAPAVATILSCPSTSSSSSTAARCSVGSSAKLSAVQFEPPSAPAPILGLLRTNRMKTTTTTAAARGTKMNWWKEMEIAKSIPGIHAALLDAVLTQFPSDADAAHFKRCARCLDAILHAEHKEMLEEMRTSYMLTQRHKESEEEDDQKQTDTSNVQTSSGFFGITRRMGHYSLPEEAWA